jgi:hypothetical protein
MKVRSYKMHADAYPQESYVHEIQALHLISLHLTGVRTYPNGAFGP